MKVGVKVAPLPWPENESVGAVLPRIAYPVPALVIVTADIAPPDSVRVAAALLPKHAVKMGDSRFGPSLESGNPLSVTVTVSGSDPCVHRLHPQHGLHGEPSISPIGYIETANASTARSGSDAGSTAARNSIMSSGQR